MPKEKFTFKYDNLVESSLTTKSAVAPSSFDFSTSKNQFQVDNQVGQILFMKDLPADLGDDLISVLSDLSIDMTITLHIESVEQDKALDLVKQKYPSWNNKNR